MVAPSGADEGEEVRRLIDRDYPPIPWVRNVGTSADIKPPRWYAVANWREYSVGRWANTRIGAVLLALYSVIGFRLTGNGYFPDRKLF